MSLGMVRSPTTPALMQQHSNPSGSVGQGATWQETGGSGSRAGLANGTGGTGGFQEFSRQRMNWAMPGASFSGYQNETMNLSLGDFLNEATAESVNEYYQERHSPPQTPMSPMDALKRLQSLTLDGGSQCADDEN